MNSWANIEHSDIVLSANNTNSILLWNILKNKGQKIWRNKNTFQCDDSLSHICTKIWILREEKDIKTIYLLIHHIWIILNIKIIFKENKNLNIIKQEEIIENF